jgi:hypothetical protein
MHRYQPKKLHTKCLSFPSGFYRLLLLEPLPAPPLELLPPDEPELPLGAAPGVTPEEPLDDPPAIPEEPLPDMPLWPLPLAVL